MSSRWKKSTFSQLTAKTDVNNKTTDTSITRDGPPENKNVPISGGQPKTPECNKTTRNVNKRKNECWDEDFTPTSCDELAVNKKKIDELRMWLEKCSVKPPPICVLTGPTGCGKTATLRVLAREYNFDIQEWINPVDREQVNIIGDQKYGGYSVSQQDEFTSFLFRASRYKCLMQTKNTKRLLLVEDFPNSILHDSTNLGKILSEFVIYGRAPLIFICTDNKHAGNLFNTSLIEQFKITQINFNEISKLLLQKAIKRCSDSLIKQMSITKQEYTQPDKDVLDSIVSNSRGDIRNALNNLQLMCLKNDSKPQQLIPPFKKSKKCKKGSKVEKLESTFKAGRQESVTFFHGIGRILNPKVSENGKFTRKPEEVAEIFITNPQKLRDWVHRNYLPHFTCIESLLEASDCLTLADIVLRSDYTQRFETNTLAGDLIVRGMMVANKSPKTGWNSICGPTRFNEKDSCLAGNRNYPSFQSQYSQTLSKSLFVVDYASFVDIIYGKTIANNSTSLKD